MKSVIRFFLVTVLLFTATFSQAQNTIREIDDAVNAFIDLDLFSGTVLIARNGEILFTRAAGEADKDFSVPNTLETKFNIGSIGKTFTATSIMQLAAAGKLNIDDPVIRYLPDFPFGSDITIHHLLTHTSGTGNYFAHPDFRSKMFSIRSVGDALPLIYDQPLIFTPPGDRFSYSNSGVVILGAVIEKVSGEPYARYLKKHIFEPLGMSDSGINFLEEVIPNRAVGYIPRLDGSFERNIFSVPPANADGGLETTVFDLLKFDQALYGSALLDAKHKKRMFTPYKNDYACCWGVEAIFGDTLIGHGGGAPGINAVFRRYIHSRYTLIVLSNYDRAANPLANTLEAILFDQPYSPPNIPIERFVYQHTRDLPAEKVDSELERLIREGGYEIGSSNVLNRIGYAFLSEHRNQLAIVIFKHNTRLFPDEANPYDSLGEAYYASGDYQRAREMYKKALEIDPQFESAQQMIKKLDALIGQEAKN